MKKSLYFPGLHALRFAAASLVIFHHIHQYKFWLGLPNDWGSPIVDAMGHKAVSFFFVLSGFLITYLLLAEHKKNSKINICGFYMRRVLRIWPLYFLVVFIAIWLLPALFPGSLGQFTQTPYSTFTVVAFFSFIPNVLRIVNPTVVGANQLWSVGIEEQFYLIWPLLIRGFINVVLPFLYGFTLLKLMGHLVLNYLSSSSEILVIDQILRLYELFPVEQMAIGAIGAVFMFSNKAKALYILRSNVVFYTTVISIGSLVISGVHFIGITYLEGALFTVVILNIIHREKIYRLLEHRVFLHLGNISYGIYMYHSVIIFLALTALNKVFPSFNIYYDILLYVLSITFTIVISHYSFQYFEKPFLKMKQWLSFEKKPVNVTLVKKKT